MKNIKIALAGNPNCGKTTLFNLMTGANQKVGNWGGVTVEIKEGKTNYKGESVKVIDLPGTYSLTAYSMEEVVARDFILQGNADVVVDVIDATNLERNLYLAVQIIEMERPVVFALNMSDELEKKGINIDREKLGKLLGVPVQSTVGRINQGIKELVELAVKTAKGEVKGGHQIHVDYGKEIEKEAGLLAEMIKETDVERYGISCRWYAIKLLEDDIEIMKLFAENEHSKPLFDQLEKSKNYLESFFNDDIGTVISEKRYGFIRGAVKETVTKHKIDRKDITDRIDKVLTNKWLAYPIFAVFMWLTFQATFYLGQYPMEWIENLMAWLGDVVTANMAATGFRDLLVNGIIGGIGSVIIFLPNILILFFFISLMEDTGYMARIAFIMDKMMHKIGLHGKSFIPLVMGIGCSVPAIMAARTLESKKDRILTILVTPLITCSARLPVYVLFAGAFFPERAGNIIFLMYVISFVIAFLIGLLFRKTLFRGEEAPFVMEMPPYRIPTGRSVVIHMWEKAKHYLEKMGGVVLFFSIIIWFLSNYPKPQTDYESQIAVVEERIEAGTIATNDFAFLSDAVSEETYVSILKLPLANSEEMAERLTFAENEIHSEYMKTTYIGRMGTFIEPVMRPAGFDWRMSVSLITGFVAKEVVVSTLGVLFNEGQSAAEDSPGLQARLTETYSPLQGFSFMLFVLLYTPCIVALVTLFREMKSWKWGLFSVGYQLALAWLISMAVYQIGRLVGG